MKKQKILITALLLIFMIASMAATWVFFTENVICSNCSATASWCYFEGFQGEPLCKECAKECYYGMNNDLKSLEKPIKNTRRNIMIGTEAIIMIGAIIVISLLGKRDNAVVDAETYYIGNKVDKIIIDPSEFEEETFAEPVIKEVVERTDSSSEYSGDSIVTVVETEIENDIDVSDEMLTEKIVRKRKEAEDSVKPKEIIENGGRLKKRMGTSEKKISTAFKPAGDL